MSWGGGGYGGGGGGGRGGWDDDDYGGDSAGLIDDDRQRNENMRQTDAMIDDQSSVIRQRDQEVAKIEDTMMQVNDIYRDLATMVDDQGQQLDNIEANMATTEERVESGVQQLVKANKYQKQARGKACCFLMVLSGVLAVGIVIVMVSMSGGDDDSGGSAPAATAAPAAPAANHAACSNGQWWNQVNCVGKGSDSCRATTNLPGGPFRYPGDDSVKTSDDSKCVTCPAGSYFVNKPSCAQKKTVCPGGETFVKGDDAITKFDDTQCVITTRPTKPAAVPTTTKPQRQRQRQRHLRRR